MSYRIEVKIVIHAETRQIAERFCAMVEDYVGDTFTKDTAVMTARTEQALGDDGQPVSEFDAHS